MSDLPQTTWTQIEYNRPHLAEVESRLHPSVVEFLKLALVVSDFPDEPCENRFFYYMGVKFHGEMHHILVTCLSQVLIVESGSVDCAFIVPRRECMKKSQVLPTIMVASVRACICMHAQHVYNLGPNIKLDVDC